MSITPARIAPSSIRALAFDLDGTLLDTGADLAAAGNAALQSLGCEPLPAAQLVSYVGHGMMVLLQRALQASRGSAPDAALLEQAAAAFRNHYGAHLYVETKPYPGALAALQALRAQGYRLACITNKPEQFTLPLLERAAMRELFGLVLGGDTLPQRKPAPEPLWHTAKQFGCAAAELLLVGDSATDVAAARAAGCPVAVVSYGYSNGIPAHQLGADQVISTLDQIADFLQN